MKFPTYLTLAVLAAQGCAGTNRIYTNQKITPEDGFEVIECHGDEIDHTNPFYIKDERLYFVTSSKPYATEKHANKSLRRDYRKKYFNLVDKLGEDIPLGKKHRFQTCKVKKGNNYGYLLKGLNSVPIDDLSKKALQRIKRYIK